MANAFIDSILGRSSTRADKALFTATPSYSVSDPAFAEFLRMSGISYGEMNESSAMGLTAYYRAQALIAGTIAGLPLKVYRRDPDGRREQVDHFLTTNPAGPFDLSKFSWTEMVLLHLLNHGETFLRRINNGGGEVLGLWPIHPQAITKVEWSGADKVFTVAMRGGKQEVLDTSDITHVMGLTTDGTRGLSPLTLFRQTLQTSKAGETAANRSFTSGSLIAGLVSSDEDVDEEEAKAIKQSLNAKLMGAENAGDIAFVNRSLRFSPWSMTNSDAQFIEARGMQVAEVARIFGVPLNLLSVAGAVSNYGTGQAEQNQALAKYVLMGWTSRIEASLRTLLPPDHFAEFEYAGLLQGTPKEEVELLLAQVAAGLLTVDEARAIRNLPPLTPEQKAEARPTAPAPAISKPPASQGGETTEERTN